jgi:Ser/Thr protein kinase RdoA (MazF antagonist)
MIATLEEIVGAPLTLEELKLKPGRRRTFRAVGPRRRAIVKAYRSDRAALVAARVRALARGPEEPEVPEVLHEDAALRLVVLSEVVGPPLREPLLAGDLAECARAGAALGRWHAFWRGTAPPPLAPHTVERELEVLSACADRAEPAIAERVRRAATAVRAEEWPVATVVHRDLYEEQIVLGPRVGLIDLDDAALGPAELDVGNLLAHVDLLGLRSRCDLGPASRALLGGYAASGAALDPGLVDRCRRLTLLRLACIHAHPALVDRVLDAREEIVA